MRSLLVWYCLSYQTSNHHIFILVENCRKFGWEDGWHMFPHACNKQPKLKIDPKISLYGSQVATFHKQCIHLLKGLFCLIITLTILHISVFFFHTWRCECYIYYFTADWLTKPINDDDFTIYFYLSSQAVWISHLIRSSKCVILFCSD